MARFHLLPNGNQIPFTPEEEAEFDAMEAAEAAAAPRRAILAQIAALEVSVTPRRMREAALSDAGKAWLSNVDSQIAALRSQLQ